MSTLSMQPSLSAEARLEPSAMTREARRAAGLENFYRRIGKHGWRESRYFTFSVRSPALRHWLAAQLPTRSAALLSIGCGRGELEHHLSDLRHRVVGLDVSHQMLESAQRRGLDRLVRADARALPFAAASFDVVIFPESIGHLALAEVFREAKRVLKERGRLLITTYASAVGVHPRYRKFAPEHIVDALGEAGFRLEERRFLKAKRNAVVEVPSDHGAELLYLSSRRAAEAGSAAKNHAGLHYARAGGR
jgi:SAM-dependent methyltransferase